MQRVFCLLLLLLILLPARTRAQSYKKLRVGAGLGFTDMSGTGAGVIFYAEPSFRLNDMLALGLRVETNFRHNTLPVLGSYALSGQYYFATKRTMRFFGGLGAAFYSTNTTPLGSCTCENDPTESVMGAFPRLGLDDGHFTFQLEYNFVPPMTTLVHYSIPYNGPLQYEKVTMNYFAVKFGFVLGGGRRREQ